MKAIVAVMDSVGIGSAPDAVAYGDAGASTLPHLSAAAGGLNAPMFEKMGLGNIPGLLPAKEKIAGVKPVATMGRRSSAARVFTMAPPMP